MEKYKVLEHTADIMIEAYGKNLRELYRNAVTGMCEQVVEFDNIGVSMFYQYEIKFDSGLPPISGSDKESSLRDFLNQIKDKLYEGFYPYDIRFIELEMPMKYSIAIVTCFIPNLIFSDEIKSITYHELKIIEENGIYKTKIVFDV